jgi:putative ABC transport system permease protein
MEKERIWVLFAKQLAKEISPEELEELHDLLKKNPDARYSIQIISVLWKSTRPENKNIAEEAFTWHLQRMNKKEKDFVPAWSFVNKKKSINNLFNFNSMLRSYFKIALRNLQKQKVFAFINVFGLSVGIACFSLLLLFAFNEFSFDKFHKNAPDIYRAYVWFNSYLGQPATGYTDYNGPTPMTIGEAMKQDLPDVIDYVRLQLPWGENLVRIGKDVHRASVGFADQALFSVFAFPLKYGNPATAFRNKNDLVLTESRAKELFGTDDVVGKTVEIQLGTTFQPFRITAVAKDIPTNSTIHFDILGNFLFVEHYNGQFNIGKNWHPTVRQTYIQLRPGSKLSDHPQQLAHFLRTYDPNYITNYKNAGLVWNENQPPISFRLQRLLSIHTDIGFNGYAFTDYQKIDPKTIWILLAIAGGILLIASINFTTLAIGRSAGRSKEVGVRKVIGADRHQIIIQFLIEALLLSIASAILGLLLSNLLLPWFNQLSGRDLHFSLALYPQMVLLLMGLVLMVGILAGSYPALVLSGFKPIEVLKNKIRVGGSNLFTRSLITFQFTLSIVLIVATIIIMQQTKYMINKNPGFSKENVVAIDASQTDPNKIFPVFKQAVLLDPAILGVTSAAAGLGAGNDLLGYTDSEIGLSADINVIDPDYIKVLGMNLIAGNDFQPGSGNDTLRQMIINETLMKRFGWTAQTAVGQRIKRFQGNSAVVIGVLKNFNYRPLSEGVNSQAFVTSPDKGYIHFYVRINSGNPAQAIANMQKAWNDIMPGIPMKYSFLDEDVNNYYQAEQRWSRIVGWAGGISIFLACLGLLGLAALAAVNRTKEIGVRKVLGATVPNIITLLSKDFLQLILVSFLIASPVSWYFMNRWLQDYADRITISWTVFLLAGVFAVGIAMITISFQAVKAAIANPVKSLRTE